MSAHARFSPSKMERILVCPGSLALEEVAGPDKPSLYALEGTAAHELAAAAMGASNPLTYIDEQIGKDIVVEQDGEKYPFEVTDEMADAIKTYVSAILQRREDFEEMGAVVGVLVEQRVDISEVLGVADQFGTADIIMMATFPDKSSVLVVEDLKYGRGVEVSADRNTQLMTYGAGAYYNLKGYNVDSIIVAIHQPRIGGFSEYEFSVDELHTFVEELREGVHGALDNIGTFNTTGNAEALALYPGEKQCRFCRAKGTCPALMKKLASQVIETGGMAPEDFEDLTEVVKDAAIAATERVHKGMVDPAQLARLLEASDMIEDWMKAVRSKVESILLDGKNAEGLVPGWMLAEGRKGARSWKDAEAAEAALKALRLKVDEMYNRKLISPAQAEKVLKEAPRKWSKVQDLIGQSEGQPTLVKDTDTKRKRLVIGAVDFEDLDAAGVV